MANGIIGKKRGMTRIFDEYGKSIPVTVIEVGPCTVIQIKQEKTDGYTALQLGFEPKREKRCNKPYIGHFKSADKGCFRILKEFKVNDPENYSPGILLTAEMFKLGDIVDVIGTSKGKGFTGVMKRWGFHGAKATHSSKDFHRHPGSIGCSATPGRVIKGHKMAGHSGNARITAKNLKIVDVLVEHNLIYVKGAIPGSKNGIVQVLKKGSEIV